MAHHGNEGDHPLLCEEQIAEFMQREHGSLVPDTLPPDHRRHSDPDRTSPDEACSQIRPPGAEDAGALPCQPADGGGDAAPVAGGARHRLLSAVCTGCVRQVRQLLSVGVSADTQTDSGDSALILATRHQYPDVARALLDAGCRSEVQNEAGRTALHEAVLAGDADSLEVLLSEPASEVPPSDVTPRDVTPAVHRGEAAKMATRILQKADTSLDIPDSDANTALHLAAKAGGAQLCEALMDAGALLDVTNDAGETPLHLAAGSGNSDVVALLLDRSAACVDRQTDAGLTPLMLAAMYDHASCAQLLLNHNADTSCWDSNMNTALILAAKHAGAATLAVLVASCPAPVINHRNNLARSALYFAAERDEVEMVQALVASQANPCLMDVMGRLALSVAAQEGHLGSLRALLKTRQGINSVDFINMAPLHWAVVGGHLTCAEELLSHGANVDLANDSTHNTPLIMAIDGKHAGLVDLLLERGCNVNAVNSHGMTALHAAAEKGCLDIVRRLIPAGVAVNMAAGNGETALVMAARRGHGGLVKFLLGIGCDVTITNDNQSTALHEACRWGYVDIVEQVLAKGCSVNQEESDGDTPLILASVQGHDDVVQLLLNNGAKVNQVNYMERSAVLEASRQGHIEVIDLLIRNGADVNQVDLESDSALMLAVSTGRTDVVRLLMKAGSDVNHCNRYGRSALHEACSSFSLAADPGGRMVDVLLEAGIDPDGLDSMDSTPLALALVSGRQWMVLPLLKANCDVNQPCRLQKMVRPIQIAVTREDFILAQMLYLAGCDMNAVNVWMPTPSGPQYMVPCNNKDMREWLQNVTAEPPALKLRARTVIRIHLGHRPAPAIKRLPLPGCLRDFLGLADLDVFVAKVVDDYWLAVREAMSGSASTNQDRSSYVDSDVDVSSAVSGRLN